MNACNKLQDNEASCGPDISGADRQKDRPANHQTSVSLGAAVSGAKMSPKQSFCISLTVITENRTRVPFVFLPLLFSFPLSPPLFLFFLLPE